MNSYDTIQLNTFIYGHYPTLMTRTEWNQPGCHSLDSDCWQSAPRKLQKDPQSWWNGTWTK